MNPWIVRLVLAILALEAGVCVAFLADEAPPLRRSEEAVFQKVLTSFRAQQEFVLDDTPAAERVRIVRPLHRGTLQPYYQIGVTPESGPYLEAFPPSPIDWTMLLRNMREVGCPVAAIEQPLTWEDGGEEPLSALDNALGQFDTAILTVDLRRVPGVQAIPAYLRRSAIPIANARGNLGNIPRVNKIVHPPSAFGTGTTLFSFRLQEAEEGIDPAVARWNDYLIPSFPLAVAMAQHNVAPDQVHVEPGRHIRLGNGPIIPIDEFGQMRLETLSSATNPYLSADLIVVKRQIPDAKRQAGDPIPRVALFTDARPKSPAPWTTNTRLQKIVSSLDVLPRPGAPEEHVRLPLVTEVTLLAVIAMVTGLLVGVRGLVRLPALALLLLAALATIILLLGTSREWTLLTPALATALAGGILCSAMSRYLPRKKMAGSAEPIASTP